MIALIQGRTWLPIYSMPLIYLFICETMQTETEIWVNHDKCLYLPLICKTQPFGAIKDSLIVQSKCLHIYITRKKVLNILTLITSNCLCCAYSNRCCSRYNRSAGLEYSNAMVDGNVKHVNISQCHYKAKL